MLCESEYSATRARRKRVARKEREGVMKIVCWARLTCVAQ
jgi:hypothetical protein